MGAQGTTAAVLISFCERLEEAWAAFYARLAEALPEQAQALQQYSHACARDKQHVVRTYQETVTDALETGFSFEGLVLSDDCLPPKPEPIADVLARAAEAEERAAAFYVDAAERSESLLATIPGALRRVARRRMARARDLRGLVT